MGGGPFSFAIILELSGGFQCALALHAGDTAIYRVSGEETKKFARSTDAGEMSDATTWAWDLIPLKEGDKLAATSDGMEYLKEERLAERLKQDFRNPNILSEIKGDFSASEHQKQITVRKSVKTFDKGDPDKSDDICLALFEVGKRERSSSS